MSFAVPVMAAVVCATAGAQVVTTEAIAQNSGLTVTYIAHCGFLFSSGDQKILTDALIEPSKESPYDTPSPDLLKKIEQGEPSFDHVNVLLISLNHIDHHSSTSSVRFLLNNPKSVLVTTPEVRMQMEKDSPEFKKIQSQVVVTSLDGKQSTTLIWRYGPAPGQRSRLERHRNPDNPRPHRPQGNGVDACGNFRQGTLGKLTT